MLSETDQRLLKEACRIVVQGEHKPLHPIHEEPGLTLAFAEDKGCLKVTLRGRRRREFDDWCAACAELTHQPDRPRTNRDRSRGDRIIFRPSV